MDLEVKTAPRFRCNSDEGWKSLFPECLDKVKPNWNKYNSEKGYKTGQRAETNPLKDAGLSDQEMHKRVHSLIDEVMGQSRPKLDADRRHADTSRRSLVVTTVTWSLDSTQKGRDWTPLAAWAVAEATIVAKYRPTFLAWPGPRAVRADLGALLKPYLAATNQRLMGRDRHLYVDVEFPWWDAIKLPMAARYQGKVEMEMSACKLRLERQVLSLKDQHEREIARIIKIVEASKAAVNDSGEHDTIDSDVSDTLSQLIYVRVFIYFSAIVCSRSVDLEQALEVNAYRNRVRLAADDPNATVYLDDVPHGEYELKEAYKDEHTAETKKKKRKNVSYL